MSADAFLTLAKHVKELARPCRISHNSFLIFIVFVTYALLLACWYIYKKSVNTASVEGTSYKCIKFHDSRECQNFKKNRFLYCSLFVDFHGVFSVGCLNAILTLCVKGKSNYKLKCWQIFLESVASQFSSESMGVVRGQTLSVKEKRGLILLIYFLASYRS